jgi:hypothetical protein
MLHQHAHVRVPSFTMPIKHLQIRHVRGLTTFTHTHKKKKKKFHISSFLNSLFDDQTVRVLQNLWTMKQYLNGTLCSGQ